MKGRLNTRLIQHEEHRLRCCEQSHEVLLLSIDSNARLETQDEWMSLNVEDSEYLPASKPDTNGK